MGNALNEFPLNFSKPELRALHAVIARSIYQPSDVLAVVVDSGMNPAAVTFTGNALVQWYSALGEARAQDQLPELLDAVRRRQPALGRRIDELVGDQPVLQPPTGPPDDLSAPKASGWKGFGAERQIVSGVDTLLGISFLAVGVDRSRSICRITSTFESTASHGTASLIAPGLLLTNHHVLHDWDAHDRPAKNVEAWFDYEQDAVGLTRPVSIVPCDSTTISGDREHDWAVVQLASKPPDTARVLSLTGAEKPKQDDYVFIIQHPDGGPKMIGLSHNLVRHVDDDVIQYWTDTKAGSSGSPVFNNKWAVVGLHHRWVSAPEGDDVTFRNQGRRIERVIDGLREHGIDLDDAEL